jgi:hypothetical protein
LIVGILAGLATAALTLVVFCIAIYRFVILPEHKAATQRAETQAGNWKDLAVSLTERGLLFRELPLLKEDMEALTKQPVETPEGEETLEELQEQYDRLQNPLHFASEGELGERRRLAQKIALKKKNADLRDRSELATEESHNILTPDDMNYLSQ